MARRKSLVQIVWKTVVILVALATISFLALPFF